MSFSIPIKKEIKEKSEPNKPDKPDENEQNKKVITYNLRFIDTARDMNRALSTLVDNLSEVNKCKCEENSAKNIKLKIKTVNNKITVFTKCKSKESQLISKLIQKFPST